MIAFDVQHISKSFDGVPVLRDLTFSVEKGSKTALIGVNGAGKTTLMRIVTGQMEADSGMVVTDRKLQIGYLAQDRQGIDIEGTVFEVLSEGKRAVIALEEELTRAERELADLTGEELTRAAEACERLRLRYEQEQGYAWEGQVRGVARGLGFDETDLERDVDSLSGGERMRVSLGCVLLRDPDLLLLDEPTNHLDISSIRWLENYLSRLNKTVILISHDRYFLDRIVDTVVEIEYGKAHTYRGNYTAFAAKKKQIRQAAMNAYLKQQDEIRHQEAVIRKLHQFNREKSVKRARSREKLLDKMERIEKPLGTEGGMTLRLKPDTVSGRDVLVLKDAAKAYGERILFEHVSNLIRRGEHVALIGDNGTGKTTLLKMIVAASEEEGSEDEAIRLGTGVTIGYYDQAQEFEDSVATLFEEIRREYPDLNDTRIRNVLAAFMFTGDDVFKQVGDLSGGEKGRLSLAKLMLSGANFLILDEPTNHLDILGKEVLEDALEGYDGTVLFVSHDRYFIGRAADRIWDLCDGGILDYAGDYQYYEEHVEERRKRAAGSGTDQTDGVNEEKQSAQPSEGAVNWEEQKRRRAADQKVLRELSRCEKKIADLELQIEELEKEMNDPLIATDAARLGEIALHQQEAESSLEEEMERWEQLAERAAGQV